MTAPRKRPHPSPSARKKAPPRGSQRPKPQPDADAAEFAAAMAELDAAPAHPALAAFADAIAPAHILRNAHPTLAAAADALASQTADDDELRRRVEELADFAKDLASQTADDDIPAPPTADGPGRFNAPAHPALDAAAEALASPITADDIPSPITAADADRERQEQQARETATKADADRERQHFRQTAENFLHALREFAEPDPACIPIIAAVLDVAADHLRAAAEFDLADENQLAAAIIPAASAAVTIADFVNGPCLRHAPQAHDRARTVAERWPRAHRAVGALNAKDDELFARWKIGSDRPRKPIKQIRTSPRSLAFDRTLDALILLLPDALRPGVFPVLPVLLGPDAQPVPPRTAEGKLAAPYLLLAQFIASIRHTRPARKTDRDKALAAFLAANDAALDRLPPDAASAIRSDFQRTRARLAATVPHVHAPEKSPSKIPAWLRPVDPAVPTTTERRPFSWGKDLDKILREERRGAIADALMPVYDRATAELDARATLRALIDRRYATTGKNVIGPQSAARDYVLPHLENFHRLFDLPVAELRKIADAARAEAERL